MSPPGSQRTPASPALPPRPERRPCAPRAATLCFWAILVLFIAALVYIGLLAFSAGSAGNGSLPSISLLNGELLSGCILACCTVAAVAGCIVTRSHRHHQHH